MKAYILLLSVLLTLLSVGFAQSDTPVLIDSVPTDMSTISTDFDYPSDGLDDIGYGAYPTDDNPLMALFGMISLGLIYVVFPVVLYVIASWSLSRLDKHYRKTQTSGISWVPFARYFHLIKNATGSSHKAFVITLLPWIVMVFGAIFSGVFMMTNGSIFSENFTMNPLTWVGVAFMIAGAFGIFAMNFWRAFIIKKYVKGDTTTALGFSTYTALVLWYVALDRTTGKTDIIGKTGFVLLALTILAYIGFFAMIVVTAGFAAL